MKCQICQLIGAIPLALPVLRSAGLAESDGRVGSRSGGGPRERHGNVLHAQDGRAADVRRRPFREAVNRGLNPAKVQVSRTP